MRIHMEGLLGKVFGVKTDYRKGISIFMDDYLRNGLI